MNIFLGEYFSDMNFSQWGFSQFTWSCFFYETAFHCQDAQMYIVYSWTREDISLSEDSWILPIVTFDRCSKDLISGCTHSTWRQFTMTSRNTPRPFFKQINEIDTLLSQLTLSFPDIEKTYIQKQPYNIIICDQCHMKFQF